MDAIATDERDAREVQEELAEYQGLDNDDLTEEEKEDQRELLLRKDNIGYLKSHLHSGPRLTLNRVRKKNHEFE